MTAAPSTAAPPFVRDEIEAHLLLGASGRARWLAVQTPPPAAETPDQALTPAVLGGPPDVGTILTDTLTNAAWVHVLDSPSAVWEHAAIYDPKRDRMLVMSGGLPSGWTSDVWALERQPAPHWRRLRPAGEAPAPRYRHTAVYDPVRDRVLLFGGTARQGLQPLYYNDVWALSLADTLRWEQLQPLGPPPQPRFDHSAVYDPQGDRMLVFGGGSDSLDFVPHGDLWALSLSGTPSWSRLAPTGPAPSPRLGHAAALEPTRGRMWLFGGYDGGFRNDLWELELADPPVWRPLQPSSPPPPRAWHTLLVGPNAQLLAHGGRDAFDFLGGFWALDLDDTSTWRSSPIAGTGPGPIAHHAAVFDPSRQEILLQGGGNKTLTNAVYVARPDGTSSWRSAPLVPADSRTDHSLTYDPRRDRFLIIGGRASDGTHLNDVWALHFESGNAGWTLLEPQGTPPPGRSLHSVVHDPGRDRMLVLGGTPTTTYDVWELSLADPPTWRLLAPAGFPPEPHGRHAAIYDAPRDRVLVYAGTQDPDDVWELQLSGETTWTQLPPLALRPVVRWERTVVYDPVSDRMLLLGKITHPSPSNYWLIELELSQGPFYEWNIVTAATSQTGPIGAVHDASRERLIYFGGKWTRTPLSLPLRGDPTWALILPAGAPPPALWGEVLAYDPGRDRMLISGATALLPQTWQVWALQFTAGVAGATPSGASGGRGAMQPSRFTSPAELAGGTHAEAVAPGAGDGRAGPTSSVAADSEPLHVAAALQDSVDVNWSGEFAYSMPLSGTVNNLTVYNGELLAANPSLWAGDGESWERFPGTTRPIVAATVFEGDLVVAIQYVDAFGTRYSVWRWNGTSWRSISEYFYDRVNALIEYDGMLIAGGAFRAEGSLHGRDIFYPYIARWSGGVGITRWIPLPGPGGQPGVEGEGTNGVVHALAVHDGKLVVGGVFTQAGQTEARYIATWKDGVWSAFEGSGVNSHVYALDVDDDGRLVVGGAFTHAGRPGAALPASRIVRWEGNGWSAVGAGLGFADRRLASVRALEMFNGQLFAGGDFDRAGSAAARNIARWELGSWSPVGATGAGSTVRSLAGFDGKLYAAGAFQSMDGHSTGPVAAWDGSRWSIAAAGAGFNAPVRALAEYQGTLVAAGSFKSAGTTLSLVSIARWVQSRWEPLGAGLHWPVRSQGEVRALASVQGQLFAAGRFSLSGDTQVGQVAAWDGASWSPVGSVDWGPSSLHNALAEYHGDLVVGGSISRVNGAPAYGVAAWDGTTWSALGTHSGPSDAVNAILVLHDTLFVGTTRGVFYLDGQNWTRLGPETDSQVLALGAHEGKLVAGGRFVHVGTTLVNGVMYWDGMSWQPMGSMGAEVRAFGSYRGDFFACGEANSEHGRGIARWNGTAWEPLGSGVPAQGWLSGGFALLEFDDSLWLGGNFLEAGGKPAAHIGRWTEPALLAPLTTSVMNLPNPFSRSTLVRFEVRNPQRVQISVYDVAGRRVALLFDEMVQPGRRDVPWNGRSADGTPVASGVYFYEIQSEELRTTRKMLVLR